MLRNGRRRSGRPGDILSGLCILLFLFSAAVVLVLNFRPMYYLDITLFGLDRESGMSVADIKANYDTLISYNAVWNRGPLVFPTLPMSEGGAIHFAEVKRIFDGIQICCLVSGIGTLISAIRMRGRKNRTVLKVVGILAILIPAALGGLMAIGWERFFVTFHQLVFRNDYWLFDPATDPVILILPDAYFLQCAVCIIALILIGACICFVLSRKRRR